MWVLAPHGVHVMDEGDTSKLFLEAFRFIPWSALFNYFKMRYYVPKIGNSLNFTRLLSHWSPCYGCGGYIKVILRSIQIQYHGVHSQIFQNEVQHTQNRKFINFTQNGVLFHSGPCYGCGGYTKVIPRSIQVHTKVPTKFDQIILVIDRARAAAAAERRWKHSIPDRLRPGDTIMSYVSRQPEMRNQPGSPPEEKKTQFLAGIFL